MPPNFAGARLGSRTNHDAESNAVATLVGIVVTAAGRTQLRFVVSPTAAADYPLRALVGSGRIFDR